MRLILLGPPGAGKGTLANLLKESLNVLHISTGDLLREEMKNESDIGREIKKFVENGQLVPDEVVTKMIEQRVTQEKTIKQGFMLDGFPRTKHQAEDLDTILSGINKPIDYVLYLEATLSVIIQRLTGRLVCQQCGAVFHKVNRPPKQTGACDACSGELVQRTDDNEETITKRMNVYVENTKPIIDFYEKQGKLVKLDADRNAEPLHNELLAIFDESKKHNQDKDDRGSGNSS